MKNLITSFIIVLCALASQAQGTCNNYWAAVSPDGQTLYFSSDRDGSDYNIYRSDIDGVSNLMRLTTLPGNDYFPSVSPDGTKIVFQNGDQNGTAEIYIMNNDGSGLTAITNNNVYDGSPNFSPDGQTIVFSAWDTDQYPEVFTMDINGNNRTQITNLAGAYWNSQPRYNRSGNKIYFLAGYNADDHIVVMDLNGSNWVDITPPNSFGDGEANFSFSPDGSKIVFLTTQYQGYNNGGDLVITDSIGGNWTRITTSAGGDWYYQAQFHPTNGKLYYTYIPSSGNGGTQLYQMDTTGANIQLITDCVLVGHESQMLASDGFITYPNPASASFKINSNGVEVSRIQVFNSIGSEIFDQACNSEITEMEINVQDWRNGIYFIEITSENGITREKLVVRK